MANTGGSGLTARLRDRMTALAKTSESLNEKYQLPTDPAKLAAWLDAHRNAGRKRMPDLQMKMNLAYTLGHQWIAWDKDKRQFRRPQGRSNDPNAPIRITVNKIGGIVERTIARLLKEAPDPECRPASDDETDVGAAEAGTRILGHEMDREKWDVKLIDLYFWVTVLGWSYLHVYWDPNAGSTIGTIQIAEEGQEPAPPQVLHSGDVCVEVVPAFELAVDPNARIFEEAKWCVRTVSLTKEACWERFGVVPPAAEVSRTLVDEVYALTDSTREDRPIHDNVAIHQMWIKPGSKIAPEGVVITWAGNTVLEKKPFPYEHKQLPFTQFDLLPGLGTREGRTWLNDLLPIQADYNDARSREASIRRFMVPKMLYPVGSIDPQKLSSRFEAIPYTPTGNPPNLMMPDGAWMSPGQAVMERAQQELGERAGQGDVSSGTAPASMPAASVMALQEADDTKMAISTKQLSKGISQTGWQWLMLVKQFWDEPRMIRTWSQEGDLEVDDFIGADLGQQLDVHVDSESSLPKSKTARLNLLMQLVAIPGMFSDPRDFLKQLDLPGISPMLAAMSIDNKQAQRENAKMADGLQVAVNDFDNHPVHITEHDNYRKSQDYEKLRDRAQAGDQESMAALTMIDAHVQAHHEAIIMQTQAPPQLPGQPGAPPDGQQTTDPNDPNAQGAEPPGLDESSINTAAGIGGPGEQGAVPGVSADTQAARTGA